MKTQSKISLVNRILKLQERVKKNYRGIEQLFARLSAEVPVGEVIDTGGDHGPFQIVDNFAGTNSAYRVARIARFELKAVSRKSRKPLPRETGGAFTVVTATRPPEQQRQAA